MLLIGGPFIYVSRQSNDERSFIETRSELSDKLTLAVADVINARGAITGNVVVYGSG